MDFDELSRLHKEFAEDSQKMNQEFIDLFSKWRKKSGRLAFINAIHFPLNILINLLENDEENITYTLFPELPDMMARFILPFMKIRDKWGKISSKEFSELYGSEYQKQFKDFFINEEVKENFINWYKRNNEKR